MNNPKGFINILIIVVVLAVVAVAGYFVVSQKENQPPVPVTKFDENSDQNGVLPDRQQNEVNQPPVVSSKQQEPTAPSSQPKPTQTRTPEQKPTPTSTPSPTPSPVSSKINSCRTISTAGEYSLSGDLTNTKSEPCIKIQNVSNVTLDCQNHTITSKNENYGIYVRAVSDFKIKNCRLASSLNVPVDTSTQIMLRIDNSKQGEIINNTVGGNYSNIRYSSFITVRNSTFNNQLGVYKSSNVTIRDNNFVDRTDPITLQEGNNNSVISNFIDGKSDGIYANRVGADDGVVINDESGDIIQGNTFQNFFDCAIENSGYMFDAKIIGNKVSNVGFCFLGGWYWSSVKGIVVKDNVVNNTPTLFYFYRQYGLKPSEKYIYFQNNTFENNKMSNPKLGTPHPAASLMAFNGVVIPLKDYVLGNNILRNNDFTKLVGPLYISPATLIVDGGGNICSGAKDAEGGEDSIPLNCN